MQQVGEWGQFAEITKLSKSQISANTTILVTGSNVAMSANERRPNSWVEIVTIIIFSNMVSITLTRYKFAYS